VLAICALLLGGGAAQATEYIWNGATNSSWTADNWETVFSDPINWPGQLQAGDEALINDPTNNPVKLSSPLNYPLKTLRVEAEDELEFLTLTIDPMGVMQTSGLVTIKGDQDQVPNATATLIVKSSGFAPAALRLWGNACCSLAEATFGASFAVANDLTIRQATLVDVEGGVTVTVGTFQIGDDSEDFFGDVQIGPESGTIKAGTFVMEGDTNAGGDAGSRLSLAHATILTE